MRRLFLSALTFAGLAVLAGCETDVVTPEGKRTHTTLEIGNGENNQIDRGAAKGSSVNPEVENGMRPNQPSRP